MIGKRGEPLPERADVVVIGAGILGLAIAYNLTKLGVTDVCIVDRGYLASGASGRNGGGVRQQWSTELNVRLMQESVALCREFAVEVGVNVWFRQGGYLFLSRTPQETARLSKSVALQNRLGVPTAMLSVEEAQRIVPQLDGDGLHAACYNGSDGILFPWPFLWGYAEQAVKAGAQLRLGAAVLGIQQQPDGYVVHTDQGDCRARRVVNAAGAWSPEIARMIGLELPNYPIRHEICSSEPLKPFLGPMVSVLATGLYFSQSMRGEIVGGVTLPGHKRTLGMGSTLRFLATYARQLCALMPSLSEVKILRQWAGPYDLTDDGNPILGDTPAHPGFYLCCGFMGHGFMMAPVVGKYYAMLLASEGKRRHEMFDLWRLERLTKDGAGASGHAAAIAKEDFIIG